MGPHFGNGDPKGGISYSVLSVEYLHELLPIVDVFVFADAGSISLEKFNLPNLQLSYGAGLRIEVMNRMPITVGYGIPVNPKHKSQVQRFYFSMGGQF
jgi:outer membrane protein insertion porin family